MAKRKRWVIKAGSNMVCTGGPLLIRAWMQQLAELRREHEVEVIWVTSGAIASAVDRTHFKKRGAKRSLSEKQALSAIGQPIVMDLYNLALQTNGQLGAQILLTSDDLADRKRKKNFQNTIEQLLAWEVTPVLNENDAVATEEIRFGDNDSLSAHVARAVGAERLLILTDVEGLYETDPRKDPKAKLIRALPRVEARHLSEVATGAGSDRGTGGMLSKLQAAREAGRSGIETWLIRGDIPRALLRAADNDPALGTVIGAKGGQRTGPGAGKPRK